RCDIYQQAQKLMQGKSFQGVKLINARGEQWTRFLQEIEAAKTAAGNYKGPLSKEFAGSATALLASVEKSQRNTFFDTYIQEAESELKKVTGFPLVRAPNRFLKLDELKAADSFLTEISNDLKSKAFANAENPKLASFSERVANLNRVSRAI